MLAELGIENLGVIPQSNVELGEGLTVLTGETGAGKTMVVSGLRLLAGARADASRVRTGADQAVVEGRFSIETVPQAVAGAVAEAADAAGAAPDENGEYIAVRTVKSSGRSRAHLGGRSVPAASLAEFTSELLTIHGQNDQLRLLSPERQLAALDGFDSKLATLQESYATEYKAWRKLAKDLKVRTTKRRELAQETDQLQFAIGEIDAVAPTPGEDAELQDQIRRLQDVDSLREAAQTALAAIDGEEDSFGESEQALALVGGAQSALAGSEDSQLAALGEQLAEAASVLSDVSAELGGYLEDLPSDPEALDGYLQRQQQLKSLTRKYAADIDGVIAWREKANQRLAATDVSGEGVERLTKQVREAEQRMQSAGRKLSSARKKAATRLGQLVTTEIHGLAMPQSRFTVELSPREQGPGPTGLDSVEFRLAATKSAEARPLATSASGGELSRVMLGLEVILAAGTQGTTLVFDEVDAGVGGQAAVEIGRRLARLSERNQVLVVTHLPQVAAYADHHLHVSKDVDIASATSGVRELTGEDRVEELARMLAGLADTATGRAHASELLERAQAEKSAEEVG